MDLVMLDTRLVGRDAVASPSDRAALDDPARSILGREQEAWLDERLTASKADGIPWRVVGQQVLVGPLRRSDGSILSADKWDGYRASRARFFDTLERHGIDDTVVLSGDFHSSWALDLPRDPWSPEAYDPATGRGSLAVELVAPGISAPGYLDPVEAVESADALLAGNPHVRWIDFHRRGYGVLDVDPERAQCDWYFVDTVQERRAGERLGRSYRTRRGRNHLEPA
jgi:alkaline phosphatase D